MPLISNTVYGRRHSLLFINCHVSWDTLYEEFRSDLDNLGFYLTNCKSEQNSQYLWYNIDSTKRQPTFRKSQK